MNSFRPGQRKAIPSPCHPCRTNSGINASEARGTHLFLPDGPRPGSVHPLCRTRLLGMSLADALLPMEKTPEQLTFGGWVPAFSLLRQIPWAPLTPAGPQPSLASPRLGHHVPALLTQRAEHGCPLVVCSTERLF